MHVTVQQGPESAGVEQRSEDVVGKVAEAQGCAAEVFEAAIDRFGGTVAGAGPVDVVEHVLDPAIQSAAEGDDLDRRSWNIAGEVLNHCGKLLLRGSAIGVEVCLHDQLIDAPGNVDRGMLVDSEHAVQTVALAIGERVRTGSEDSADPVKGIPRSTAMPAGDLLDPLPAAVQCVTGHGPNPVTSRYTLICEEPVNRSSSARGARR